MSTFIGWAGRPLEEVRVRGMFDEVGLKNVLLQFSEDDAKGLRDFLREISNHRSDHEIPRVPNDD